ncbi:MAG: nucleotidyltransferase family protein [Clostridia bacterium]|nr:nucleotidyltransferase family protein [Clostridia bacterium]
MTNEMEYLMHLFGCGARGVPASAPKVPVDWERVASLASNQSVTYTTAIALKREDLGCPAATRDRLLTSARGAAVKNLLKTEQMLTVVGRMQAAGIRTLVIKGADVARFYANPELRVSADTDLLVAPADEQAAQDFLLQNGFTLKKQRPDYFNHSIFEHPTIGLVEVHIALLPEMFRHTLTQCWNLDARAMETSQTVTAFDLPIPVLEPTIALLFLTEHMMKHFLYGGTSLRMMMDTALYAIGNAGAIDRQRYADALQETKYAYTVRLIFGALVRYCGIDPDALPLPPAMEEENMQALLDDLELGGWQGVNHEEHAVDAWRYYRYTGARAKHNSDELRKIGQETRREYRHALVPTLREMQLYYPVLFRRKWLYPFCVVRRLISKFWKLLRGGVSSPSTRLDRREELSEAGKARLELFERLDLI